MLTHNVMHLTHNNSFLLTAWAQFIFLSGYEGACKVQQTLAGADKPAHSSSAAGLMRFVRRQYSIGSENYAVYQTYQK